MSESKNALRPIEFIGIGAARSGSSWVGNVLRKHPDIAISEPKEVRYFNRYQIPVGKDKGRLNPNHAQTLDWYYKRFAHAKEGQIRGEISPVYLLDEVAAPAIKKVFPDIKLILCVRNPVKRAYSSYRLHRGLGVIDEMSFEQALEQEVIYVEMGLYAKQLKHYLDYFERKQILVVVFEQLIKDPAKEFKRIFEFLGVAPDAGIDYSAKDTNESVSTRSKKLHRYALKFSQLLINSGLGFVMHGMRRLGVHKLVNKVNSAPSRCEPMLAETKVHLMQQFAEDISQFEMLLDIDLDVWRTGSRAER
jgi:Sulfotransferase domain